MPKSKHRKTQKIKSRKRSKSISIKSEHRKNQIMKLIEQQKKDQEMSFNDRVINELNQ